MATITLEYDGRNPIARKTIDYVLSLGLFRRSTELDRAIAEADSGKLHTAKDEDDLIRQCLK